MTLVARLRSEFQVQFVRFYDPVTMGKYGDPEDYIDGIDLMIMLVRADDNGENNATGFMGKGQTTELACATSLDIPVLCICDGLREVLWHVDDLQFTAPEDRQDWARYQAIALDEVDALSINHIKDYQVTNTRKSHVLADNEKQGLVTNAYIQGEAAYVLGMTYEEQYGGKDKPNSILLSMHW